MGKSKETPKAQTTTTKKKPPPKDNEWSLHYYQDDPNVPGGFFGPSCRPGGDADSCREDLKKRMKRDPMLLSVILGEFNLLPGQEDADTADEREQLRRDFAIKLRSEDLRKQYQPMAATALDTLRDLRVEKLRGLYFITFISDAGRLYQARKPMDPTRHEAICGIASDGRRHCLGVGGGDQPVSRQKMSGIPLRTRTEPSERCPEQGTCGTPSSGPEQNQRQDPGRTQGYSPDEGVRPAPGSDSPGEAPTQGGTDAGSPGGGHQGQSGADEDTGQPGDSGAVTNPPAAPPHQPPAVGDPCAGDPNACGGG